MINKNGGMALLTVLIVLLLVSFSVTALLNSSLLSSKMAYYGQQQLVASQQVFVQHQQNLAHLMIQPGLAGSVVKSSSGGHLSTVSELGAMSVCTEEFELMPQTASCTLLLLTTTGGLTTERQLVRYHSLILLRYPDESAQCTACARAILLATYADESGEF